MQKNPGLRFQIAFHVPFADYSTEELCEIARHIGHTKGMSIDDGAIDKWKILFEAARLQGDFGNGRYVRNVFEQAKMNQERSVSVKLQNCWDAPYWCNNFSP